MSCCCPGAYLNCLVSLGGRARGSSGPSPSESRGMWGRSRDESYTSGCPDWGWRMRVASHVSRHATRQ
eukprot:3735199-Pyramimonas_sp.AAC.1